MKTTTISERIRIDAPAHEVWRALTDPDRIARWMNGAQVETDWQIGSPIRFRGQLLDKPYDDRGTVLAYEPQRLLTYSHWSEFSRRLDTPEARSLVSIALEPAADGGTLPSVTHSRLGRGTTARHAIFFRRSALHVLKHLSERPRAAT